MFKIFEKQQTFRPKKLTRAPQLEKHIFQTVGSGDIKGAVRLPPGENLDEWLAVNTIDFYNQINLLNCGMKDMCTAQSCPIMCAGPKYEYYWSDGVTIKTPIKVSAPEYVEHLLNWIQVQLDNPATFPTQPGVPYPAGFDQTVKTIFRRMFRVFAHIYCSHFDKFVEQKEEAHLNSCFKHFYYFVEEFNLIDKKELAPVQSVIDSLLHHDAQKAKK
eukprot:TRINITY_DN6161_c0_g1_i3.p1 TRINITY_DN6161_c0_g1~~TRINITY_DN6161_c0_g1_i3.p1  ORF type:complete len:216 (-),score=44.17 TRINITY_DN6161_c0_g1_i3:180-827(-)